MLAYDFPIFGLFTTMLFLAFWVVVVGLLVWVLQDVLRSPDLGGFAKVLWIVLVIVLPLVGFLVYMVFRERANSERDYS